MPLHVGTQVVVSPFELVGQVVQCGSKTVTVQCGSIHVEVCRSKCRAHFPTSQNTHKKTLDVHKLNLWHVSTAHTIDLHGMSVTEALDALEKWLSTFIPTYRKQLQVVHGKGSGRLKKAVRDYLQEHAAVRRILELHPLAVNSGATWIETH